MEMEKEETVVGEEVAGARCPMRASCQLFSLFSFEATLRTWQVMYCDRDHLCCVRYQDVRAGKMVPAGLLPNGKLLAPEDCES
jgi:hypothetical protein